METPPEPDRALAPMPSASGHAPACLEGDRHGDPQSGRSAAGGAPRVSLVVRREGRIQFASPTAALMFGYAHRELLQQPVEGLFTPACRAELSRHLAACPHAPSTVCLDGQHQDGSAFAVQVGVDSLDSAGASLALLTLQPAGGDDAPADEEQVLLREVVEAAPNGMFMVRASGRITLVNRQAEQMFGYDRSELLGQPIEMLVPERFRQTHPLLRRDYHRNPSVRLMGTGRELFGRRRDGSEVPLEIGLNPIQMPGGLSILLSVIDITQRKRNESLLLASLQEKGILLREVHHRVKNNLQVISSMLSLQGSYVDDPEYRRMFGACEQRVRTMALIHDKLYGAKSFATLDFADHVRDLTSMLTAAHASDPPVVLALELQAVHVDVHRAVPLGLILNELVTNALRHAFPSSPGTIRIQLEALPDDQAALRIDDDGSGMAGGPDAPQQRGLGLRIVRSLVRQLHATIELESKPSPGSRFCIVFSTRSPAPPHD